MVGIKVYYQGKVIEEVERDTIASATKVIDSFIHKLEKATNKELVTIDPTEGRIGGYTIKLTVSEDVKPWEQ